MNLVGWLRRKTQPVEGPKSRDEVVQYVSYFIANMAHRDMLSIEENVLAAHGHSKLTRDQAWPIMQECVFFYLYATDSAAVDKLGVERRDALMDALIPVTLHMFARSAWPEQDEATYEDLVNRLKGHDRLSITEGYGQRAGIVAANPNEDAARLCSERLVSIALPNADFKATFVARELIWGLITSSLVAMKIRDLISAA